MASALAETGNAGLEPGTAPDVTEQPQGQEEETRPAAETEAPPETETEDSQEPTEAAPPADPLAALDDDALTGHERIAALLKDREQRAAESARQRSEAQTAQRIQQQVAQYVQQGNLYRDLNASLQDVIQKARTKIEAGETLDSSELVLPAQTLQQISNSLYAYLNTHTASQWELAMENLSPVAQLPEGERAKVEKAALALQAGRSGVGDYLQTRMEAAIEAAVAAREPELKKRWQAEAARAAKKEEEIKKQREADAARNGATAPSAGHGDTVRGRSLDDVLGDPSKTLADKKAAFKASTGLDFDSL